jgi:hypothetical protein
MNIDTTTKIAELNDLCRTAMGVVGRIIQTDGIRAQATADQSSIREKVERFDMFTPDNDPYQERDFGSFRHNGECIFGKINYYDRSLTKGARTRAIPRGRRAC